MSPRKYRRDILMDGYSPTWEGRCINQKSPLHRSLPRRRRCSTSMTARGGPMPTMSTPLSQVSLKPAGMIRLCLSARWWNSAMPCPRRTAVLWPPAFGTRGAAVLLLLDPDRVVRRAVAEALATVASSLSPTEVRRLVAMRNWRPENERAEVDGIVRKARAAGVDCAQWEAGRTEPILATAIDGAATKGFLLVSPPGRKKRISSILTKGGVADAWSGEPESPRRIEAALTDSGMDAPMLAVSRSYLDRVLSHQLALSVERGVAAPLGLLQVAETLGGVDWQPARMDFDETLARLITEIPEAMRGGTAVETVLRKSGELADLKVVAQSWFETVQILRRR